VTKVPLAAVCGRFITYRSARASKDHHCIFGLQTSSHSPGPRCIEQARNEEPANNQLKVQITPGGGELGPLFPAAVRCESRSVRLEVGEPRQRAVLEVLRFLPTGTGGAGLGGQERRPGGS